MTFLQPQPKPNLLRQIVGQRNVRPPASIARPVSKVDDRRQPNPTLGVTPTPPDSSPVDDGTNQVNYGAVTEANPAPATPDLSIETLTKTPEYMARERALAAAMELFGQTQATDKARFEEKFGRSLTDLGYDPTNARWDLGEMLTSGQRATESGRAFNALRNDFAARGMLQSGAFQAARNVLQQQLNDRLTAVQQGRTSFLEDQAAAMRARQQQDEQQRQAALQEARDAILSRFAMGG